jgi:tetratricopeptide (TPR) repeat protein
MKKVLISLLLLAVLAGLGLWLFGRPAYHRYKAERSFKQARAFLEKGDLQNAALSLRQTLALNPSDVKATRQMAELVAEIRSPAALGWWRRVVELEPTMENQILLAAIAQRFEKPPFPIAAQTLEQLRGPGETNLNYHLVAAQLAIRLNQISAAQSHLRTAIGLNPTNQLHQFNLATLRLQASDAADAEAARKELLGLADSPTLGANALRSLSAQALKQRRLPEAQAHSERLLALPQATFEDVLHHLTVLDEAKHAELPAWIERMQQRASTNSTQAALAATWLKMHQRAREAVTWLGTLPPAVRDAMPVPLAEAECFIAARDWTGLEERLDKQRWDELEFLRLAFLARAHREQGRGEIARASWTRAMNATAARVEYAAGLVQLAADWGWTDEAEDLLWVVAKRTSRDTWPLQMLFRHYTATKNTLGLYRVHQVLLERDPTSLPLKNNLAMYALLLDRDLARAGTLAKEAYEAEKTNTFFVSTYAFSLHVRGKSTEGLKLMQTLPEAELQRPEIATYYAVLLSAAGERDKAKPYFAAAEKGRLLPEERRLLVEATQN